MQCSNCTDVLHLDDVQAIIYWMSEIEELSDKSRLFLSSLGCEIKSLHGIYSIYVENAKSFFETNMEILIETFKLLERDKIKLFVDTSMKEFSFESIIRAKSLQYYINLIEDREFFNMIDKSSMTTHFQPIIKASDRTIYGYEALTRGIKENGELMYPDVFFEKSTRNDINFKVDRLCRETAMKNASLKKINQTLFINFIPTSIYDPEFCLKSTVAWANELGFNPANIVFEVIETEMVQDQEHLKTILKFYREQGFKIALDDVGEGFSNLNILIKLQPDIIKIDRNIIQNIDQDPLKQSVYKALFTLAKENGIEVLAEGLETDNELKTVERIGVDYIQGYYFGKPQSEPAQSILQR